MFLFNRNFAPFSNYNSFHVVSIMETSKQNIHEKYPRGMVANVANNVAEMYQEVANGPNMLHKEFAENLIKGYREGESHLYTNKHGLSSIEVIAFSKFLKGANFRMVDSNNISHGILRSAQSYLIWRLIQKLPESGDCIVFGSSMQESLKLTAAKPNIKFHFHIGNGGFRDNERLESSYSKANDLLASASTPLKTLMASEFKSAYNMDGPIKTFGRYTIAPKYQDLPSMTARMGVAIDSLYDISPRDFSDVMSRHQIKICYSIRHVAYELKHTEVIINPVLGFEWRKFGNKTSMIFPDQSPSYTHDTERLIEWSKDSISVNNSDATKLLVSAVHWKSAGYGIFIMTHEARPKEFLRTYITSSDHEVIYIYSMPTLWRTGALKRYPVTKAKYQALLNFVMSSETDAKKLVGYMRSSLSAFSIGQVLVDESWDLYSVDIFDIIVFAVTHGIAMRTEIIDSIKKIGDFIRTGEFRADPWLTRAFNYIISMIDRILVWLGLRGEKIIKMFHEVMQTGVSSFVLKQYWKAEKRSFGLPTMTTTIDVSYARHLIKNFAILDGYGGPLAFIRMSKLLFGDTPTVNLSCNHSAAKLATFFNPDQKSVGIIFGAAPGGMAIDLSQNRHIYTILPAKNYRGYIPYSDVRLYGKNITHLTYNRDTELSSSLLYPWMKNVRIGDRIMGTVQNPKPTWGIFDAASGSDHGDDEIVIFKKSMDLLIFLDLAKAVFKVHCGLNEKLFGQNGFTKLISPLLRKYKLKIHRTNEFGALSYEYYFECTRRIVPLVGKGLEYAKFKLKHKVKNSALNLVYSNWLRLERFYTDQIGTFCSDLLIPGWGPPKAPPFPPEVYPDEDPNRSDDSTEDTKDDSDVSIDISTDSEFDLPSTEYSSSESSSDSDGGIPPPPEPPAPGDNPINFNFIATGIMPLPSAPPMEDEPAEEAPAMVETPEQQWGETDGSPVEEEKDFIAAPQTEEAAMVPECEPQVVVDNSKPSAPPITDKDLEGWVMDMINGADAPTVGDIYQATEEVDEEVEVKVEAPKTSEYTVKLPPRNLTKVTGEVNTTKKYKAAVSQGISIDSQKHTFFSPALTGVVKEELNHSERAKTDMQFDKKLAVMAENMDMYYVPIAPYGQCFYGALALLLAGTQWAIYSKDFQNFFTQNDFKDRVRWSKGTNTKLGNLILTDTPDKEAFDVLDAIQVDYIIIDEKGSVVYSHLKDRSVRWGIVVLHKKMLTSGPDKGKRAKHADVFLYNKEDTVKRHALHPNIRKPNNLTFPTGYKGIRFVPDSGLKDTAEAFKAWIGQDQTLVQTTTDLDAMSWQSFRAVIPMQFVHGPPGAGKTNLIVEFLWSLPAEERKQYVYTTSRRAIRDEVAVGLGNKAGISDPTEARGWADRNFVIKTYLKVFKLSSPKEKPYVHRSAVKKVIIDEYTLIPGLVHFGLGGLFPNAVMINIGDPYQNKLDLSMFPELKTGAAVITKNMDFRDLITPSDFVSFSTSTYRFSSYGLRLARLAYGRSKFKPLLYAVNDKPYIIKVIRKEDRNRFDIIGDKWVELIDSKGYLGILPNIDYMTVSAAQGLSVDTANLWLGPSTIDNFQAFPETAYVGTTRAADATNIFCGSDLDYSRVMAGWIRPISTLQCPNAFICGKMNGTIGGVLPHQDIFNKEDFTYEYAKEWAMRGRYVPDGEVTLNKTRVVRRRHIADPRYFDQYFLKSMLSVPEHVDNSRESMVQRAIEHVEMILFKERFNKIERQTQRLSESAFGKIHFAADSMASVNTFVQRANEHIKRSMYKRKKMTRAEFQRVVHTITLIYFETYVDKEKWAKLANQTIVDEIILKAWTEFTMAVKFTKGHATLTWHEIRWHLSGFLKTQIKPKGKDSPYENKGGQPIVQGEKVFNLCFSLMFRVFKAMSALCFKDEFMYATGATEEQQYDHYLKYKTAFPESVDDMADCTQYDATMDERTDACEAARWKLFDPFDHDLSIYYWLKRHRPVYLKEIIYGVREARGSGQPDTEAGNTNTNQGTHATILNGKAIKDVAAKGAHVPIPEVSDNYENFKWGPVGMMVTLSSFFAANMVLAGIFIGDDCLIIIKKNPKFSMFFYDLIFMTALKLEIRRNSAEFCNHIFSIHGFCYNPHKLVEKLMQKDFIACLATEEKWLEFREGLEITVNRYLANPEGANKACAEFFNGPVEFYSELWKQLDAFVQLPYKAIRKLPMYDVWLRSDTYGGVFSSTKFKEVKTSLYHTIYHNYAMEQSHSGRHYARGRGKKVKNSPGKAENKIINEVKALAKKSGKAEQSYPSNRGRKGPGGNRGRGGANQRPTGPPRSNNIPGPMLKEFVQGEILAKKNLNRSVLDQVAAFSAPENMRPIRIGSRNAMPVNIKKYNTIFQIKPSGTVSNIDRFILFKDVFRQIVHWSISTSATATIYEAIGVVLFSEAAPIVASKTFSFIAALNEDLEQVPTIKYLNYVQGQDHHGQYLFPGLHEGKCGIFKGPLDKIKIKVVGNSAAVDYKITPYLYVDGRWIEKPHITVNALATTDIVGGAMPAGYYAIGVRKIGAAASILGAEFHLECPALSGTWGHKCSPAVVNSLRIMGATRTVASSMRLSNFSPNIDLQGSMVAVQASAKDSWLDWMNGSPDNCYGNVAAAANSMKPVSLKKGLFTFVKPTSLEEFEFTNVVDNSNVDTNEAGFNLVDRSPYVIVVTKVASATDQVYNVTCSSLFEFTTDADGEEPQQPRNSSESLDLAIQCMRPIPQYAENPEHLKKIWGFIKKVGALAYKAYEIAKPIYQVAEAIMM